MLYTRGSYQDYDRYARVTGDDGWSWDALEPYILKVSLALRVVRQLMPKSIIGVVRAIYFSGRSP